MKQSITMKLLIKVAVLAMTFVAVYANAYCKKDTDCSHLGGLKCIKSICDWGICSCDRGYASRYFGSERLYQCVPLKKVGESCSFDSTTGWCGAQNSFCANGTCECAPSYISIWGGERCVNSLNSVGETCGNGRCSLRGSCGPRSHSEIFAGEYPTCSCSSNEHLELPNAYGNSYFTGKKQPTCVNNRVGDTCFADNDCPREGECVQNKCACKKGTVMTYGGGSCLRGTALKLNEKCGTGGFPDIKYCDGAQGLVCGETCVVLPSNANKTCQCGPSHKESGGACHPNKLNSVCFGDGNCKTINNNAICRDGKCINGAVEMAISMTTIFVVMVAKYTIF